MLELSGITPGLLRELDPIKGFQEEALQVQMNSGVLDGVALQIKNINDKYRICMEGE